VNQEQIQYSFPVLTSPGIYKITFINGLYYIGSASNLKVRCRDHISKLKNGKHENPIMQNTFLKYPHNIVFEVLEVMSKELLLMAEQKYLDNNIGNKNCININPVANKPPTAAGRKLTIQHKACISAKMKGRNITSEWRKKIGQANKKPENLVKRRLNLYKKRWKEIYELQEQRNSLIEYFI
jgi:group I intron endonuclease